MRVNNKSRSFILKCAECANEFQPRNKKHNIHHRRWPQHFTKCIFFQNCRFGCLRTNFAQPAAGWPRHPDQLQRRVALGGRRARREAQRGPWCRRRPHRDVLLQLHARHAGERHAVRRHRPHYAAGFCAAQLGQTSLPPPPTTAEGLLLRGERGMSVPFPIQVLNLAFAHRTGPHADQSQPLHCCAEVESVEHAARSALRWLRVLLHQLPSLKKKFLKGNFC